MIASKTVKATRLPGIVFLCATLLGAGSVMATEQNGLSLNGLSLNGLSLNSLCLNEVTDKRADAVTDKQSRETEAARVWDSVRQLSKKPLAQKK